ncbi:MAG: M20/M25/M40 family metallo-hydrolase [Bacteroidota bacterium]
MNRLGHIIILLLSPIFLWSQKISEAATVIKPQFQEEIKVLSEQNKVLAAFELIKAQRQETLEDLIQLTEIEAPPFKEEKRAAQFVEMIKTIRVDSIWIDEVGNVLALRKGTKNGKTVVLDAHLDTVFPEGTDVNVKMKGDTLYAPGIADDTRGLAMLIRVLSVMNETKIKTEHDVLFVGSVGEEGLGDLRGVKYLFSEKSMEIDSWISIDGGALSRVNNKALGSHRYQITFQGPGGHSWGAFGLANPHHALGSAIHYFTEAADQFTSYGLKTSYNVGIIEGGTSINSVPFSSTMQIDMRSISPARLDSMDVILKTAVQKALDHQNKIKRIGKDLTVKIEKIGDRPSGEHSEDLPIIQRAMAAVAFLGKRPQLTRGSTNSNIPISMRVPAVTIGRGGVGRNAHSLDEWWLDVDAYKSTQLALLVLLSEAKLVD